VALRLGLHSRGKAFPDAGSPSTAAVTAPRAGVGTEGRAGFADRHPGLLTAEAAVAIRKGRMVPNRTWASPAFRRDGARSG